MSHDTDHSGNVRKVLLPSGETIEIVAIEGQILSGAQAPTRQDDHLRDGELHLCGGCGSGLVQPLDWSEASSRHWEITLHCPNCDWVGTGVFDQDAVERYDTELDRGTEVMMSDLQQITAVNMLEEIERFSEALHAGFIVPDDF